MAKKGIYKITLLNWEKNNSVHKKSYKKTLIDNNFCWDSKMEVLPMSVRWLYLGLILICGDMNEGTIKVSTGTLQGLTGYGIRFEEGLNQLQSLQLLNYEKIEFLRIEVNRIEVNRIEEKRIATRSASKENPNTELNRSIWECYRLSYNERYGVDPVRNRNVNSKISQLAKRLGTEAISVVKFYVNHPDSFYVKNLHDIGLCLKNAEALRTQWLRGKPVTGSMIKEYEKHEAVNTMLGSFSEEMYTPIEERKRLS